MAASVERPTRIINASTRARFLAKIAATGDKGLSRTLLSSDFFYYGGSAKLDPFLDGLIAEGLIERRRVPSGLDGRFTATVYVAKGVSP